MVRKRKGKEKKKEKESEITDNDIGKEGAAKISEALMVNTTLVVLDLASEMMMTIIGIEEENVEIEAVFNGSK